MNDSKLAGLLLIFVGVFMLVKLPELISDAIAYDDQWARLLGNQIYTHTGDLVRKLYEMAYKARIACASVFWIVIAAAMIVFGVCYVVK